MPRRSPRLALILLYVVAPFAAAQTETIANPNGGGSIVQIVTTDINGLPVTNTLPAAGGGGGGQGGGQGGGGQGPQDQDPAVPTATPGVPAATTATPGVPAVPTTATTPVAPPTTQRAQTTTTPGNLGPVQQPPASTPVGQGVTSYQYTTVDALGQTTVIQDIFTPTYNTPPPQQSPMKGTVLSPSDFSAMIGTHTAGGPTSGVVSWRITSTGAGGVFVLICGAVIGALTVL